MEVCGRVLFIEGAELCNCSFFPCFPVCFSRKGELNNIFCIFETAANVGRTLFSSPVLVVAPGVVVCEYILSTRIYTGISSALFFCSCFVSCGENNYGGFKGAAINV